MKTMTANSVLASGTGPGWGRGRLGCETNPKGTIVSVARRSCNAKAIRNSTPTANGTLTAGSASRRPESADEKTSRMASPPRPQVRLGTGASRFLTCFRHAPQPSVLGPSRFDQVRQVLERGEDRMVEVLTELEADELLRLQVIDRLLQW